MRGSFILAGVFVGAMAVLSSSGCVVDAGEEDPTGEEAQALRKCGGAHVCKADQYCARPFGECGGRGRCDPKPDKCLYIDEPVCGCDGVTYSNLCFAAMMGASAALEGSCEGT
jgi:hypothetical protein